MVYLLIILYKLIFCSLNVIYILVLVIDKFAVLVSLILTGKG